MKKMFALILAPVVLLLILVSAGSDQAASPSKEQNELRAANLHARQINATTTAHVDARPAKTMNSTHTMAGSSDETTGMVWEDASGDAPTESLIAYAMSLMGSPYVFGGTTASGFDCSGFTSHVYKEFGIPVSRSSGTQSDDGVEVDRSEARPGDLIIFTGTNPQKREPGHVGIVISEPGDTISFVHSSSNGGVKVSQVEGTGYEVRFMGVRRVL